MEEIINIRFAAQIQQINRKKILLNQVFKESTCTDICLVYLGLKLLRVSLIVMNKNKINRIVQMHSHRQVQPNTVQKQEEQSQPMKYHIGVKSCRMMHNVYNTLLLSYAPHSHLLVNHGQDLMIYNSKTKQITKTVHHNHTVSYIKCTYSRKWRCLFLMDTNQKLAAYSEDGLLLLGKDIDLKSIRHCLDFMYLDEYGAFLVLTPEHLKLVYIQINSNHLRSLFANAYKFRMKQTGVKVLQAAYFLQFSNKIRRFGEYLLINNSENLKIIWHSMDHTFTGKQSQQDRNLGVISAGLFQMAFGGLPPTSKYSRKTIIHLMKICDSPQQITQIMYSPEQCVLLCGTNMGNLKVFKINTKNIIATTSPSLKSRQITIESKSQLAFKLSLHNSKPVISIQMYSPRLILSVGADEHIEVVSFDQMASIEKFKSSSHLADIAFVSNSTFLAVKTIEFDQFLYSYEIALDYELLVQHNSQVLHTLYNQQMCVLVLTDNSLNVFQLKHEDQNKNNLTLKRQRSMKKLEGNKKLLQLQTIEESHQQSLLPKQSFVPPRCKSILCIETYPFAKMKLDKYTQNRAQQFWILTDESEIYRYTFTCSMIKNQKISKFQIIDMHELYHFQDTYKHETKEKVCTMKFVDLVPVYYDSDIREKNYYPNFDKVEDVKPIAFGCQTGELLVCSSLEPTKIISRFRCFGEAVAAISSCHYPDQPPPSINQQLTQMQKGEGSSQSIKKGNCAHVRRLIIFSSLKEIVAVMLSNYLTPNIVYKLLLNSVFFITKPLSSTCAVIVNGNIPKLLFPCYRNDNKLRLWTPQKILHESTITCLEHCTGIKVVTGDEIGKIVIWNLYSQVLANVTVSEPNLIEICYCWKDTLLFGYHGKIFQLQMDKLNDVHVQPLQLFANQKWVSEASYQLSLNSSPTFIYKFITFQHHSQSTKLEASSETEKPAKKNIQNSNRINSVEMEQVRTHQSHQSVEQYVDIMKKSLIKLTHQAESNQTQIPKTSRFDEKVQFKAGKKRKKHISTTKNIPQKPIYFQGQNEKIERAMSILGKYRQAQKDQQRNNKKNDISLPQIRNISMSLRSEQTEEGQITKRKKHKNKNYQFLFHFPNTGLYTQLISKNMLD